MDLNQLSLRKIYKYKLMRYFPILIGLNLSLVQAQTAPSYRPNYRVAPNVEKKIKDCNLQLSDKANQTPQNECYALNKISENNGHASLEAINSRDTEQISSDGQIVCWKISSYTIDYDSCVKTLRLYDGVLIADKVMDMQQKVRTDLKNQNLQQEVASKSSSGDLQNAATNAAIKNHEHMKALNGEKVAAYLTAVAALSFEYKKFPNEKFAISECTKHSGSPLCSKVVENNFKGILPNFENRTVLASAITKFMAKAAAAGVAIDQHNKAKNSLENAQNNMKSTSKPEPGFEEVMVKRCAFNPQDPACIKPGNRISGGANYNGGTFSAGGGGSNNSIVLNPEDPSMGDLGSPSTGFDNTATNDSGLDDKNQVGSVNSPFQDEVKEAQGILNPAGKAETQATGGAGGGGGGGGGGGMGGGGGASLGNDLEGPSPDANKTSEIKAGKVSGMYGQGKGGEGFKGVGKSNSKDEANPFSSLFEQKDQEGGGGIEEDRSIASEDIDLKSLDLFQKISKRYNQVHLDKRIEAKNLDD